MRKAIGVAVICLAASLAFAATGKIEPLKARTGLWQMTKTINWTLPPQLPPQYAQYAAVLQRQNGVPDKYKSCVKQEDLTSNPWSEGTGEKCTWTVLKSTGTDMEIQGSCDLSREWDMPATAEGRGKIHIVDSENGTGSEDFTVTVNGMTAKGHASYTGKWIGATCTADVNN